MQGTGGTTGSGGGGSGGGTTGTGGAVAGEGGRNGSGGATGGTGGVGTAGMGGTVAGTGGSDASGGSAGDGFAGTRAGGAGNTGGGAGGRGGTGGSGGTGGATAGASGVGGVGGSTCEKGQIRANEVVLVGDSYFEIPNQEVNAELARLARAAGAIGPNEMYRDRAISGTRLAGGSNPIPMQYANAQAASPIKVLIMDGGGNDIIQSNCVSCAGVTDAIDAARMLIQRTASDGTVQHIVFFFYPYFPNFPALRADAMDFMRPMMQSICAQSTVPCHFIDLRPIWEGHPEYTGSDNLHPSVTGARVLSRTIWNVMQQNCIAQ